MARLRFLLPLALVAGVLSVPAALGAGAGESIKISGRATLQAPATVLVTVTYSCLPATGSASNGSAFVQLVEAHASGPAGGGSANFLALCDDRSHTETVAVSPGPWTPGTGDVRAQVCGLFCADNFASPTEVTIR
jgi:hypothetical protein